MGENNPISAALARSHPDAEDDFYEQFWQCKTIGELVDLAFRAMHVEGRSREIDWRRLERNLYRLQEQANSTHHGGTSDGSPSG